jgi:hypothetical protein
MINHARTLLLNQSRNRAHYSDYGYEYVPPEFKPVVMPAVLQTLRRLLFGAAPDNYFLNFRANELLAYVHSTELAEYAYRFDPRVTYWPKNDLTYFEATGKRVTITQIFGQPQRLAVAGNLYALTAIGKSLNFYTVSLRNVVEDGLLVPIIDVKYEGKKNSTLTVRVPNISSPPVITLPDTELSLRLNPNSYAKAYKEIVTELNDFIVAEQYDKKVSEEKVGITSGNIGLERQWLVETRVNPAPLVTSVIPAIELLGEPAFLEIFGVENKEPYLTFKNLWFDHPLPAYRLSGIVLALIYRTEELRG